VDEFVEQEAEGLRSKAEEAKEELDRLADLQNLRAEVAFNSALAGAPQPASPNERAALPACVLLILLQLCASRISPSVCWHADINREADEFEEQLRRSREEREASERALQEWEDDVAVRRSEGQFFQNLYQTNRKRPVGLSAEQLKERAERVKDPARSEVSSRLRSYLFAFLAFLLSAEVVADLRSGGQGRAGQPLDAWPARGMAREGGGRLQHWWQLSIAAGPSCEGN
jgi:hypothetical protein